MPQFIIGADAESGRRIAMHNRFPRFFAWVELCQETPEAESHAITKTGKDVYEYRNPVLGVVLKEMILFDGYTEDNPLPMPLLAAATECAELINRTENKRG